MAHFTLKHGIILIRISKQFSDCLRHTIKRNIHLTGKIQGNVIPFKLSDIGEGIREVSVKEWFVKEGDKVSQFDNICEVQSDKASVTITSRYDGIIKKIHYMVDQTAYVGQPLIDIQVEGDEKSEKGNAEVEENNTKGLNSQEQSLDAENLNIKEQIIKKESNTPNVIFPQQIMQNINEDAYKLCIPSVRRLARQYKIDLNQIRGSGKNGRILKEDIIHFLKRNNKENEIERNKKGQVVIQDEIVKMKGFQKAMLQTMTVSLKIPHFVYTEEIKITKLSNLRKSLNSNEELNMKISFVPFFVKALSLSLKEYPMLNSSLDLENENIILKKRHNIGIAMDTKIGLAVPVIKNVQDMGVLDIAKRLKELMENGKKGNFTIEDLKDGTLTLSNIGVIGGLNASPVILAPQVAIVAFAATKVVPRFDENMNVIAEEVVNISGAADHRIIDGATMANFISRVKKYIENPYILLMNS